MTLNGLRLPLAGVDSRSDLLRVSRRCERIRYLNSTGTSVKDSARLAISDRHTDSDSGENRYLAVPCSRKIGTNTMQMHSVESRVGTPTSPAPSMIASSSGSPIAHVALDVLDHDRAVIDQDADRQRKAAERHGVERLPADIHDQHGGDDRQRDRRRE